MPRRNRTDERAPFQSLEGACRITGLSTWYLRNGCKSGRIPHIMVGSDYRVNVPALLAQLNQESLATGGELK